MARHVDAANVAGAAPQVQRIEPPFAHAVVAPDVEPLRVTIAEGRLYVTAARVVVVRAQSDFVYVAPVTVEPDAFVIAASAETLIADPLPRVAMAVTPVLIVAITLDNRATEEQREQARPLRLASPFGGIAAHICGNRDASAAMVPRSADKAESDAASAGAPSDPH